MEKQANNMEVQSIVVKHKTRCMDTPKALKGEDNPCKELTTTFDFSGCSEEEILNLASKTCIIAFRTKCKVNIISEKEFAKLADGTIDVKDELLNVIRGLTKEQKIEKLVGDMDKDTLDALIKRIAEKRA